MIGWVHLRQALLATTCLAVVGPALVPAASAAPSGLSVGSGQISVSNPNATTTLVQQGSNKAVLNWNSFSIAHGESVVFQQPNASSIALNRVTGGQASSIMGRLTANGHVWLVNPNGILFGSTAAVNVASLIATTSDIRDSDFLGGNYSFGTASPNPNAGVVNQGVIQAATGGTVVLSGGYVRNDGLIQANLGSVVMAGAKTFSVDFAGDKLLSFAVTNPVDQLPLDANGKPVTALVSNTGTVAADGGHVMLTAHAVKGILDNVINTTGIVEANTAAMVNGTVVLDAGDGGVTVGGQVSATGLNPGETGGTVKVLAGAVTVASGATINTSGDAGGGSVVIGGDFHGAGPDANAWTTEVQQGATITADAVTSGNGGGVAVWADGYTAFNGTISARGGTDGGNGGFVETSGKQGLSVQTGSVNTLAPNGQAGTWLLDPTNIVVSNTGSNVSTLPDSSNGGTNNTDAFSGADGTGVSAGTDTIATSAITTAAASNSTVLLQATNNITFNNAVSISTGASLTAQAGGNISVNANISTTTGLLKLSANDSGGTPTGSGGISIASGASLTTTTGTLQLLVNGGTGSIVDSNTGGGSLKTTGGAVHLTTNGSGNISLSGAINTIGALGVNGGAVVISAGGNVSIGGGETFSTAGSGNTTSSAVSSIITRGFDLTASTGQTASNGGQVAISAGGNLDLPFGIVTRGGDATFSGSSTNGGNAGSISLSASNGALTIGSPGSSTGDVVGLFAQGGSSYGGGGGNGANISAIANTISLARAQSNGGDTLSPNGLTGGNGGNIALAGKASSGAAITIYGEADSPALVTATPLVSMTARGGFSGISAPGQLSPGTVTGSGGNVLIGSSTGGGVLNGSSFIQLATGKGPNGGSTVAIGASGGLNAGGSILINGPINATTSNGESLRLYTGDGKATLFGSVGSGVTLNSVVFGTGNSDLPSGGNGGAVTFNGPVTAGTQIYDLRGSGSLTFNGFITTPSLNVNESGSTSLAMKGGGLFTGDIRTNDANPITIGGNFTFTSSFTGNFNNIPPFVLSGSGAFDSSALNTAVSMRSIAGNGYTLTINPGSGSFTVGSISNTHLALRGSGTDTFNGASGLSFDFSGFTGTAFVNGTKIFPIPASVIRPVLPPPVPVILFPAPPSIPIVVQPIALPVVNFGPAGPFAPTASSGNAPQTVEGIDTGGSMFASISPATPSSGGTGGDSSGTTGSSASGSGGTSTGSGSSDTTTSGSNSSGSNSSGSGSSSSSGSAGNRGSAASGGGTGQAAGGSPSTTPPPPSDSSDRALAVIAAPPPVRSVSHPLPVPPRVTSPVVPGFVNQVQHPAVPKSGTPGIQQNFSASGNAGRW